MPIRWTRIITVDEEEVDEVEVYAIDEDLEHEYEEPRGLKKKSKKKWKAFFNPKEWWSTNEDHRLEFNKLENRELKSLAK